MAIVKRKHAADSVESPGQAKSKKSKLSATTSDLKREKNSTKGEKVKKKSTLNPPSNSMDLDESDTTESENGFYGFSAKENTNNRLSEESSEGDDEKDGGVVIVNGSSAPKVQKDKKARDVKKSSIVVANNGMTSEPCEL